MEDGPYRDIRYSGEDLPPIKSFDESGNVILGNSFSKIFSAGSRLGYMVANDQAMAEHLKDAKSALNSHTSQLPQILCAEFFKRGYYPAHHKMICDLYRERRDTMVECLGKYFPEGTKFTYPDGGLFTWAQLPRRIEHDRTAGRSGQQKRCQGFLCGRREVPFPMGAPITNCMRISFGAVPPEKIRLATERLDGALRKTQVSFSRERLRPLPETLF